MKKSIITVIFFSVFCSCLSAKVVNQYIDSARSHLGSEEVLNGVQTLQLYGTMEDDKFENPGDLEFKFKKPFKHYNVVTIGGHKSITATNGYEGFMRNVNLSTEQQEFFILYPAKVKQLIITAAEKLYYLKGVKKKFGKVIDDGLMAIRGEQAHRLTFRYPGGIIYRKYFDPQTWELRATTSSDNGYNVIIVEEEHMTVKGIRFASKVSAWDKNDKLIYKISFHDIKVNEEIDDELFNIPSVKGVSR